MILWKLLVLLNVLKKNLILIFESWILILIILESWILILDSWNQISSWSLKCSWLNLELILECHHLCYHEVILTFELFVIIFVIIKTPWINLDSSWSLLLQFSQFKLCWVCVCWVFALFVPLFVCVCWVLCLKPM